MKAVAIILLVCLAFVASVKADSWYSVPRGNQGVAYHNLYRGTPRGVDSNALLSYKTRILEDCKVVVKESYTYTFGTVGTRGQPYSIGGTVFFKTTTDYEKFIVCEREHPVWKKYFEPLATDQCNHFYQ